MDTDRDRPRSAYKDLKNCQIADKDAVTVIENFQPTVTDSHTDMIFSKNRRYGRDTDMALRSHGPTADIRVHRSLIYGQF